MLLHTIFRHEWREFLRQRWMQAVILLFILTGLVSVFAGNHTVRQRFLQTDSIRQAYRNDYEAQLQRFADTLTEAGKAEAKYAGMSAMVNYRLPQTVIKEPDALAPLALGMMDVQPWYVQVKSTKSYSDETEMPVSNPMVLYAGNFDLSFVIVYLLPLLVLAFTCSLYSAEKEAGTLPLLSIQAGGAAKVIRARLLFRFLLTGAALTVVSLSGFALAEKRAALAPAVAGLWLLLCWLYLLCWFALAYFILSFRKNAGTTALWQAAVWVLLLIVAPSVVNSAVQAADPLPMKDEIAAYRRHQGEEIWNMPLRVLTDSFNFYNPQYLASADPAKDTVRLSDRSIAGYYDLLDKRMSRVILPYEKKVEDRNERALSWLAWNPAVLLENNLSRLAGNQLENYRDFRVQTDSFQKRWQAFMYGYNLTDTYLEPEDFKKFPVFRYKKTGRMTEMGSTQVVAFMLLPVLLVLAGFLMEKSFRNGSDS